MASTGQIGIIKVLSAESYKGGTRLHILCGLDAFELIRNRMDELSAISRLLSAKPEKILEQTKRLIDENDALKRQLADIEQRKAARIISSLSNSTRGSFCVFTEGLNTASMRDIANEAVKLTDGAAGIFCQNENGWNYIIASDSLPLRSMSAQINSALNGKGGGSDKMLQGSCMAERTAIEDVIKKLH